MSRALQPVAGTTPPGTQGERQAAQWVERMFAQIAFKYDLLNHLLSFNIDRRWRKVLLRELAGQLANPKAQVLDLCCGTGDVLLDFEGVARARLVGADFCHPMLKETARKARARGFEAALLEADALRVPVANGAFDAVAIAFGFRNLTNYQGGLREMHRILKPGGRLAILEFSHPTNWFVRLGYSLYSKLFLPVVGWLVSGSREAYTYLPDSIRRFPKADRLRCMMQENGFAKTDVHLLTGGIAALHVGTRSADQG